MVSPYEILGVRPNQSEEKIKEAYRERLKETHPDHGGSESEFRMVKKAYDEIAGGTKNENIDNDDNVVQNNPRCSKCNNEIEFIQKSVYYEDTKEIFCSDCSVKSNCSECGTKMYLSVDRFQNAGGEPICTSCGEKLRKQERRKSKKKEKPSCSRCGTKIEHPQNSVYHEDSDEIFCNDCSVKAYCNDCGKELLLTIRQFENIGGEPICKNCGDKYKDDWKIAVSIFGLCMAGVLLILFWYYRPTIIIHDSTYESMRTIVRGIVGAPLLVILWLIFRAGSD